MHMNSPVLQLLVLAAIAIFLILRLRSVLGTREGFEKPLYARHMQSENQRRMDRGEAALPLDDTLAEALPMTADQLIQKTH